MAEMALDNGGAGDFFPTSGSCTRRWGAATGGRWVVTMRASPRDAHPARRKLRWGLAAGFLLQTVCPSRRCSLPARGRGAWRDPGSTKPAAAARLANVRNPRSRASSSASACGGPKEARANSRRSSLWCRRPGAPGSSFLVGIARGLSCGRPTFLAFWGITKGKIVFLTGEIPPAALSRIRPCTRASRGYPLLVPLHVRGAGFVSWKLGTTKALALL
jgi:hypothetical protein